MSIPTDLGDALIAVPARIRFALARLQLSRAVYKLPAAQITSKTGSNNLKLFEACQNFSCITGNSGNNLVVHETSHFDQVHQASGLRGLNLVKTPFFGSDSEFGVGECSGDLSLAK